MSRCRRRRTERCDGGRGGRGATAAGAVRAGGVPVAAARRPRQWVWSGFPSLRFAWRAAMRRATEVAAGKRTLRDTVALPDTELTERPRAQAEPVSVFPPRCCRAPAPGGATSTFSRRPTPCCPADRPHGGASVGAVGAPESTTVVSGTPGAVHNSPFCREIPGARGHTTPGVTERRHERWRRWARARALRFDRRSCPQWPLCRTVSPRATRGMAMSVR